MNLKELTLYIESLSDNTIVVCCSTRGLPTEIISAIEISDTVQPLIILKGIEFDIDESEYNKQYNKIKLYIERIYGDKKKLLKPVVFSDFELWKLFNINYTKYIMDKYKIYNPCLTCRAYYMILKLYVSSRRIIMLERKLNKRKTSFKTDMLNALLLQCFDKLKNEFKASVLEESKSFSELKPLIDQWPYIKDSKCLFDRSWRDSDDKKNIDTRKTMKFIDEFIYPVSKEIITLANNSNGIIDYGRINDILQQQF